MSPAARRGVLVFLIGLVVLLGALVADVWWLGAEAPSLGVSIGGPFSLADQNGVRRTPDDFRGKLMLVYFGYTYCPDACPTALQEVAQVLDQLGPAGDAVVPVFISIDPERDTVEQMKLYASNFSPRLVALTGTPKEVDVAARAYRVFYRKAGSGQDYLMDHSSYFYLMGRDGRYLAHFVSTVPADALAQSIKRFL